MGTTGIFDSTPLTTEQADAVTQMREAFKTVRDIIVAKCPDNRERSLAITELEYSCMRSIRAIAHSNN